MDHEPAAASRGEGAMNFSPAPLAVAPDEKVKSASPAPIGANAKRQHAANERLRMVNPRET
jgi:hypothetical protein